MQRNLMLAAALAPLLVLPACVEPACHGECEDDHGEETGPLDSSDSGSDEGSTSAAVDYCGCMLVNCHDAYHSTWGEDHVESESACLAEAQALPAAGMDVDAGNFIECRLHYCEAAQSTEMADDPENCPKALGAAVCL